ncbi:hypothetical protein ANCCAN_07000 [Ancylostoma caninum]|uniref:Uncharacterized protein n=1 Tax=Ancylostoma caninum TaxID=29170 RepID=A0A368GVC9_ANCCA|nr:hypothetical protein ANCCAN_07000 [Ancylostoma caninum]
MGDGEMKVNGLPAAAVPDKAAQAATPSALAGGPSELLQLMMQGGQIPELSAETQAQLMALMMAGAGAQPTVEEPSGEEQQSATSSVVPSFPMPPTRESIQSCSISSNCTVAEYVQVKCAKMVP